jgi:hypothetical protein
MSTTAIQTAKHVADRRKQAARTSPPISMFGRMLLRAAVLRRRRAASALLAMVVAAAVATAMMNLYVDVQAKLRSEFRNYGANVIIVARDGQSLPADSVTKIEMAVGAKTLAVPFSYIVARTKDGQSVAVRAPIFARPPTESLVEGEPLAGRTERSSDRDARGKRCKPESPAFRTNFSG